MNAIRYLPSHTRPQSLRLLREFQCQTLELAARRRPRHLDTVVLRTTLPPSPTLPARLRR